MTRTLINMKWNSILRDCCQKRMECLVDNYENQLTKNTMAIFEAYDSLGTIGNWSKEDKKELENEVHNHLEALEKLLQEQKEREVRNGVWESNIATYYKPSGNLCRDTEKPHQRKREPRQL